MLDYMRSMSVVINLMRSRRRPPMECSFFLSEAEATTAQAER